MLFALEVKVLLHILGLTSIVIPSNVGSIGFTDFGYCENLNSVTIEDGIVEILDRAFEDCINLTSIVIPASVDSMGDDVFLGCSSLTDIYCEAESKPEGWDDNWNGSSATVHWGSTGPNAQ